MALCDANYKFTYINVGATGRNADGGVFMDCALGKGVYAGTLNLPAPAPLPNRDLLVPYYIIADDAFPLHKNIMKPYPHRNQNVAQRVFNYRLSRARRIIENTFGIASTRFRVLRRTNELPPEKVKSIVCAICVLHNFLLTCNSRRVYAPNGAFDNENNDRPCTLGAWRNENHDGFNDMQPRASRIQPLQAKEIREELWEYFLTKEGELPWQYQSANASYH